MNKYLIATFFIMGAMSAPQFASAETCESLQHKVGDTCTGAANVTTQSGCTSTSAGCKFVNCNGNCHCRVGGTCPDSGGTTPGAGCSDCVSSINWSTFTRLGVQSGTPVMKSGASSLVRCTTCKATVYRCASGYYADTNLVIKVLGMPEDCVSTKPTYCKPCPSAPDYDLGGNVAAAGAPDHVDSPAGFAKITDCYVKANSDIKTTIGTYVYTDKCQYTQ